jgi:hypothetical protein
MEKVSDVIVLIAKPVKTQSALRHVGGQAPPGLTLAAGDSLVIGPELDIESCLTFPIRARVASAPPGIPARSSMHRTPWILLK